MGTSNFDELKEGGADVPSGTQQSDITDPTAATAQTATAPAALTSAQITGGEAPTEAEYNALQADVAALRTVIAALVVDTTNGRAAITSNRAKIASILDTLDAFGQTA